MTVQRFAHQIESAKFKAAHPRCFDHSDPGTGKTLSSIDAYTESKKGRMLVLAPLSILQPSWGQDIEKFSNYSYSIAHGTPAKREQAMTRGSNIVITNHDAVNWIAKDPKKYLSGITHCVIDEYTAFKNRTTQRGKAVKIIADWVEYLWLLSGTPGSNGLCDIWYPALLLDKGERLGKRFWDFRSQVSAPTQVGPRPEHIQWVDKPGAELEVAARLKDITIRFQLRECISMPENVVSTHELEMPSWIRTAYEALRDTAFLELGDSSFSAVHAGAKAKKILQLLSGSVYNNEGEPLRVHDERYDYIITLILERKQCVVAYNWKHEVAALVDTAERAGITYGVINGDASIAQRNQIVADFQAGKLRAIFAHPKSAGHGLTLTAGTTTIWASPTFNAEFYKQFNARIDRNGQTERTETIRVAYKDSPEVEAYEKLGGKVFTMDSLLDLMVQFRKAGAPHELARANS